ncbi:MAG TPA: hypothetical protein VMF90_11070 [Rhizobiaceae bacterium]|nr:hypothetical protein [Rhizobiaceae bacterium]
MGAISVRDEKDIWGASNRLIYYFLLFCIRNVGEKGYLIEFKNKFDWGYNSFSLCDLTFVEKNEFLELAISYSNIGDFETLDLDPAEVKGQFDDLINRLRDSIRKMG